MLGGLYILMAMMLVAASLMSRRERPAKLLVMALALGLAWWLGRRQKKGTR